MKSEAEMRKIWENYKKELGGIWHKGPYRELSYLGMGLLAPLIFVTQIIMTVAVALPCIFNIIGFLLHKLLFKKEIKA